MMIKIKVLVLKYIKFMDSLLMEDLRQKKRLYSNIHSNNKNHRPL